MMLIAHSYNIMDLIKWQNDYDTIKIVLALLVIVLKRFKTFYDTFLGDFFGNFERAFSQKLHF